MYRFLLLFISFFFCREAFANFDPFPIGARGWGLGNALVAMPTNQTFFYNPAGLGYLESTSAFASYHSRYDFIGLGNAAAGGTIQTSFANIGIGAEQFGDKLYHESKIGMAVAKKQGRVALGFKVSYFQIGIDEVAARSAILTEFGVMADIRDNLRFGFHGYNLTGATLFQTQNVPTVLRLGISYRPSKQIAINAEAEKSTLYPILVKAGLEYEIRENMFVRTGVNSLTNTFHFGTGLKLKHIVFDYAVHTSTYLGLSHHLTLSTNIKKKGGGDEK